jgi:signal transduction histidine kinase
VTLQIEGIAASIPSELREQLEELRETARHGTEEVRRIARRLRPEALEDLGLQSALSALASSVGEQAGLHDGKGLPNGASAAIRRAGARDLPRGAGGEDAAGQAAG